VQGRDEEPGRLLDEAWRTTTPGLHELVLFEAEVARQVAARPTDYEVWLRLVAVFHLLTEGVIATTAQRFAIRTLSRRGIFPGMLAGFAALARDEGRHVSFGLHALRAGVEAGYGDAIWEAVERIAPAVIAIDVGIEDSRVERVIAERSGRAMRDTLGRRLRTVGAPKTFITHVCDRCTERLLRPSAPVPGDGPQ
jgi:ribonucleotide reductase beta subunit family protein with ferritin-like domain